MLRYTIRHTNGLWWTGHIAAHQQWTTEQRLAIMLYGEELVERELATYLAGVPVEVVSEATVDAGEVDEAGEVEQLELF